MISAYLLEYAVLTLASIGLLAVVFEIAVKDSSLFQQIATGAWPNRPVFPPRAASAPTSSPTELRRTPTSSRRRRKTGIPHRVLQQRASLPAPFLFARTERWPAPLACPDFAGLQARDSSPLHRCAGNFSIPARISPRGIRAVALPHGR
jgi:hypothetical protein